MIVEWVSPYDVTMVAVGMLTEATWNFISEVLGTLSV